MTAAQATVRNDMVAALAATLIVPYASQGGKTWETVLQAIRRGDRVFTLDNEENEDLSAAGAKFYRNETE